MQKIEVGDRAGGTKGFSWGCEDCLSFVSLEHWIEFDLYSPDYRDIELSTRRTCKRLCTLYYEALNKKEW